MEVGADRGQRAAWDRHEPFPGPVGVDAQHAGVEVKVALLERDRLRCADPARGQQFEQGAVAQRGGARSARLREQLVDLPAAEGLGAPLGKPRAGQRARRVALDHRAAVQVTVERAQARGLALQRRGRERLARPAVGQLRNERGQLVGLDGQHVTPAIGKERAELSQIAAVRLERVTRQTTLQLEVGQEVQHETLERLGSSKRDSSHNTHLSPVPTRSLPTTLRPRSPRAARRTPRQQSPRITAAHARHDVGGGWGCARAEVPLPHPR